METKISYPQDTMPDVAMRTLSEGAGTIDWVGMRGIRLPLRLQDDSQVCEVMGSVQLYLDLDDPLAKGIHMSRLYTLLDEASRTVAFSPLSLQHFLQQMLDSQVELSTQAYVEVQFERALRRPALVSANVGWGSYPAWIRGTRSATEQWTELGFSVKYSSTCPASAALARQSIQEKFALDFGPSAAVKSDQVQQWLGSSEGVVATPHGQRSQADITLRLPSELEVFPLTEFIGRVECALETPVQTAVKREDEQEFAILNGQNPMFCEDACRRLRTSLDCAPLISDFLVRVEHFESLHAHNVVAWVAKGLPGGLRAPLVTL